MEREVIRWMQSLDLTQQVRHPRHDLANGFVFAEITSRHDRRVSMHSYVPGCSTDTKRSNWKVLLADLKRVGFTALTKETAEAIMQEKPDVGIKLLGQLYEFFCGKPSLLNADTNSAKCKALLEAFEYSAAVTQCVDSNSHEDEISLPLMTTEIPLDDQLRRPAFAQPTASALLRVVNNGMRATQLSGPIPLDDSKVKKRNEELIAEHESLYRALKRVNPQRFLPKKRLAPFRDVKAQNKASERPKSRMQEGQLNTETSNVHFQMSNALVSEFLRHQNADDGYLPVSGEQYAASGKDMQICVIFKTCGNDLRQCLSRLLGMVLDSQTLSNADLPFNDAMGVGDVFSSFIGQRNCLPMKVVSKCWEILSASSGHIAQLLLARPSEYFFLLRGLGFLFSHESAGIRMLHVSGDDNADQTTTEESGSGTNCPHLENSHPAVKNPYTCRSPSGDVSCDRRLPTSNLQAYNVSCAYGLLYNIGLAVNSLSPSLGLSLLTEYFLPAASSFLPTASSMVLEAVARLVVAHLCGNGKPCNDDCDVSRCSGVVSSNGFQAEQHESEESKKEEGDASICEMTASQLLISFLLGPLKGVFVSGNASHETCTFQQRTQYGLLLYHILKYARGALRVEPPVKEKRRLSISDKSLPASFPPTVLELCADRMQALLASSSPKERAVGVAVLLELTLWNRWDLAIETIRNIINEMRLGAAFTAFARPSADAWELRILLLQLFTLTFQRAMNIVTEECDSRTSLTGSDSGPLDRGTGSTTASFIGKQINMQELEEVTVKCMKLFYNAPLVQRELALQIVSKTLLPEKQMNVASAWVECLFTLPIDHLCSLLGVDDTRHHRRNFGAEPQVSPRAALPSRKEGVGLARQAASADSQRLSCSGQPAGPNNEVGQVEDVRLPVRVLLGHVEPAYVIPPMNRTWNVFTVVQTLLLFHSKISTTQLFTVIHAALLGAWHDEGELRVLMSNLRALEFGDSFVFSRASGDDEDLPTSGVPSSRKAEDTLLYRGGAGAITLRNLVRNARVDSVSEHTLSDHNIDRDEELAGTIDSATAVGTARGCTSANTTHSNLEDAGYSGDRTGTLVEFFWLSVLRQIRPQLEESFSEDKVGSDSAHYSQQGWQKKKRKDGESEGGMTWRACRFSVGEDLSRLRMLGGSILLNLYRRYANPSTRGSGMMSLDVMHRARKWLSGI